MDGYCSGCKFCDFNASERKGECKRYPPTIMPWDLGDIVSTKTKFPIVEAYWSCGEHMLK
jgi:hypothetical protein